MNNRPKVGLGVCLVKDGKVLWGKRKVKYGEGMWCWPGGHLEFGESWEDYARRETLEETGLQIKNVRMAKVLNHIFLEENKHYITVFMMAEISEGEVTTMEPDKFECWEWFAWDELPKPLFASAVNLVESGFDPFLFSSEELRQTNLV